MSKYTTYAITIRFRNGITDDEIKKASAFIKKKSEFYYIITEKLEDDRHLHAAVILKKECSHPNFATDIVRLFKEHDAEERRVLRKGVKVMYSYDFICNYLNKDDDTVIIEKNMPEKNHIEHHFPPPKVSRSESHSLNHHKEMKELEVLWYEYMATHVEINTSNVRDFLFNMMYNERRIGLLDDKKMFQTARHLTRWINKVDSCKLEIPPFEKEEGPGFH